MVRSVVGAVLAATFSIGGFVPAQAASEDARSLPMSFQWRSEGPREACGDRCRVWISAIGNITTETPGDFRAFAQAHDVRGATLVLDSGGGSVLAALALGRDIRRLDMTTTVGRTIELGGKDEGRARLAPNADCESMCAFVLLAGARRYVPPGARVFVHQIWLGDKREDATAASYSAEDIALIQRDIGRLALYTAEMGGAIELIETALRIPPWERMRVLSAEELRRMRLQNVDDLAAPGAPAAATISAAPAAAAAEATISAAPAAAPMTFAAVNERGWSLLHKSGQTMLARRHPLTVEGEQIGSFDLMIGCGDAADAFSVVYVERRRILASRRVPEPLKDVAISFGRAATALRVVSTQALPKGAEMTTYARGAVPAAAVKNFALAGSRSLSVATAARDSAETSIRVGNTGVAQNFPRLVAACGK